MDAKDTIEIESKPFGKIEVSKKQQIIFNEGLYGFEKEKEFYLLDMEDKGPFYYLQSGQNKDLVFILINPYMFKHDFIADFSKNDLKKLKVETEDDAKDKLLIFAIVTIPENNKDMTANLLGPVLINKNDRLGIQALSLVEGYTTKHNIMEELNRKNLEANGGAAC